MKGYCSKEHGIVYSTVPFVGCTEIKIDEEIDITDDLIEEIVEELNEIGESYAG